MASNPLANPPRNVFTLPTPTDMSLNPFWTTTRQNENFILQKSSSSGNPLFKNVLRTIANVFDTNQPPYRILFQREVNTTCLLLATAETENVIENAWNWIVEKMIPQLDHIDDPYDKEEWVASKIQHIVTHIDVGVDEKSADEKVRNASRSFRQSFDVPPTERLVSYYSCAYNGRQGWLYISENYLGFYSFLLGVETKVLVELKDIQDMKKEKSKRNMFSDSLLIVTKDKKEHHFSNLFRRDETYDLLVQLTSLAIEKLLKNTGARAPGAPTTPLIAGNVSGNIPVFPSSPSASSESKLITPLRITMEAQKRNEMFAKRFRLPLTEVLHESVNVLCIRPLDKDDRKVDTHPGRAEKVECEQFCSLLKTNLKNQVELMKQLKPFLATCWSEFLLKQSSTWPTDDNGRLKGGLGMQFAYPGDVRELQDRDKMSMWKQYFEENGRNLTMLRLPTFGKLVRIGLPNTLRGEIWEMCSGSAYLRFYHQGEYDRILKEYEGSTSLSTEEIEKDLNRSLPEYAAYQSPEGINKLRRVLTAYSWKNPALGYCQAMNIVCSALLIYMSEEQAFWTLSVLVDNFCPGYYSTSMYGAMLDQIIFEHLVERTMPILDNHMKKTDGTGLLFHGGTKNSLSDWVSILKINGDELLQTTDDGAFFDILKTYFTTLDQPVHQKIRSKTYSKITNFTILMRTAYREFSLVTDEMVLDLRRTHQLKVIAGVESFTKRTGIRNLQDTAHFSKDEISIIYDKFYGALYYAEKKGDKTDSKMDGPTFRRFLASITTWVDKRFRSDGTNSNEVMIKEQSFVHRLFNYFDRSKEGVSLQDAVLGLSDIFHGGIMSIIDLFFNLYDSDKDGTLGIADVLELSKELLCLYQTMQLLDAQHLSSITSLLINAYEQYEVVSGQETSDEKKAERTAKYTLADNIPLETLMMHLDAVLNGEEQLELSLPSFRMVVLTDETLETFFSSNFPESFTLKKVEADSRKSLGREIFDHLFVSGQTLASRKLLSQNMKVQSPSLSPSVSQRTNSQSSARTSPSISPSVNDDLVDLLSSTSIESKDQKDDHPDSENAATKNIPLDELFKEFEHFDTDDGYQLV
ncbi:GTPase activating protein (GAP) [Umbelopsis nana]